MTFYGFFTDPPPTGQKPASVRIKPQMMKPGTQPEAPKK